MKIPFTLFIGSIILLSSCTTNQDVASNKLIQKRKYTKGYHVNIPSVKEKNASSHEEATFVEEVEAGNIEANRTIEKPEVFFDRSFLASNKEVLTEENTIVKTLESVVNESASSEEVVENVVLSREEEKAFKREFKKEARKAYRDYKSNSPAAAPAESVVLYVILAIFIPPLAVGLLYGIGAEFWISVILTIIFWIPGIIYALIKVFQKY